MSKYASPISVLITGATGGIGKALALAYAAPARTLVLHGRDPLKLSALKDECERRGARVISLQLDLLDTDRLMASLAEICSGSAVDLVIVNAGITNALGPDGEHWRDIDALMNINLRAAMATVSAVHPHFR